MAIYHLSVKTISRSAGRSATAAAAYRAGDEITDERTGTIHDYTRKGGVESTDIILPANAPEWAAERSALWNAAEQAETRKNSTVAREFEIALPAELPADERRRLAVDFARELVDRHGLAADVAIHAPNKHGDDKNHHAHILVSTRRLKPDGFTEKTRELDDRKSGEVDRWRERFATLQNERLEQNGIISRVDHRSLEAQGIDREPTRHLGPAATGFERRTGEQSRKRYDFEQDALAQLAKAKELGELEREAKQLESSIIDLSGNLERAKAERLEQNLKSYEPLLDQVKEKLKSDELSQEQSAIVLEQFTERLIKSIDSGKLPRTYEPAAIPPEARQIITPAPKPEPPKDQLAGQTLSRLIEEERLAWRKKEEARLLEEAEKRRLEAWKIKAKEPKKPLLGLYATDKWKSEMWTWERDLQYEIDKHHELKKQAQDAIEGKAREESWQDNAFYSKAHDRLKNEYPELFNAWAEKRQAEREKAALAAAKAAADRAADKAVSDFKALAVKREGKSWGYGDSGNKWGAVPDELEARIEAFNQHPRTDRGAVLEKMRADLTRSPAETEKLTKQLEQGMDKGFER